MAETQTFNCPNCSAPITIPIGETETSCAFCSSHVRRLPGQSEMKVVRTREEMKSRERIALEQERMRQDLAQRESEAWRQTAAKVAIAALPILGRTAGGTFFRAALHRGGCCGCLFCFVLALAAATVFALLK